MADSCGTVIGGVDCHLRAHHVVALDARGQKLGDAEFPADRVGYEALHRWLEGFGPIIAVGVESTAAYGAVWVPKTRSALINQDILDQAFAAAVIYPNWGRP